MSNVVEQEKWIETSRPQAPSGDVEYQDPCIDEMVAYYNDWRWQVTPRVIFVASFLSFVVCFIQLLFGVSGTGVSPPGFSVISSVLGYLIMKPLIKLMIRCVNTITPYTKQENTCLQAICTVVTSVAMGMGYYSWLWALSDRAAAITDYGITSYAVFEAMQLNNTLPTMTNTIPMNFMNQVLLTFMFGFTGTCIVFTLRKHFILDMKLPFPSPSATGVLINQLFNVEYGDLSSKQLRMFIKYTAIALGISFVNWLFGGSYCAGLSAVPFLGIRAMTWGWSFDIGMLNFLGVGVIMTTNASYSIVLGAVLVYGFGFYLLYQKGSPDYPNDGAGAWFNTNTSGLGGFYGYRIIICIFIVVGDGVYPLFMMVKTVYEAYKKQRATRDHPDLEQEEQVQVDALTVREYAIREQVFAMNPIPHKYLFALYAVIVIASTTALPYLYEGVLWYLMLVAFVLVIPFSIMGTYVAGVADINMTSSFAKFAVLFFSVWAAAVEPKYATISSLLTCGIIYAGVCISTDVMSDFMVGYLTNTSTKAIAIAHFYGMFLAAFVTPTVFAMFTLSTPDFGFPGSKYPNTFGVVYRSVAMIGNEGFGTLPENCLKLAIIFGSIATVSPFLKHYTLYRLESHPVSYKWVEILWPNWSCIAIPVITGTNWVIPLFFGLIISEIWKYRNKSNWSKFYQMFGAAFIVGSGLWSLTSTIFALAKIESPMCVTFAFGNGIIPKYQPWV